MRLLVVFLISPVKLLESTSIVQRSFPSESFPINRLSSDDFISLPKALLNRPRRRIERKKIAAQNEQGENKNCKMFQLFIVYALSFASSKQIFRPLICTGMKTGERRAQNNM
jgi:hypothetical protein